MIRAITYYGLRVQWHGRHLLHRCSRILRGPVLYLFSWLYVLFAALDFFSQLFIFAHKIQKLPH